MSEHRDCNPASTGDRRLWAALVGSLLLHGFVVAGGQSLARLANSRPPPSSIEALQATLVPTTAGAPTLLAPEALSADASVKTGAKPAPIAKVTAERPPKIGVAADLATLASRQVAHRLLYPEEAVARGLEGEALVLLFLDAAGNAVAARLEKSSGHALLDAAAVAAARSVRALPEGDDREVLLPVRFRLN